MAQEIKMSAAGLKAMQEELEYLKTVRRKELAEEIKEARSHGDQFFYFCCIFSCY